VWRQRTVGPLHPAALEQQPLPEQVVEFQPPVAGDGLNRPIDPGGDLLDERSLARTRRPGDVQPVALGRGQKRQLVTQGLCGTGSPCGTGCAGLQYLQNPSLPCSAAH